MDENLLTKSDKQLIMSLSIAPSKFDKYIILLKKDFGYNLSKSKLAILLDISEQTIDRRIKEGINIPNFIRSGEGKKASYIFPIIEVAQFLSNTVKIA